MDRQMNKKKGIRPIWLIVLLHKYYNWRDKKKYKSKFFRKSAGHRHSNLSIKESLDYINLVFNDYKKYSGLEDEDITGKKILEIGPGDNFGVALRFLAAGAEQVCCIDKFHYETKNRNGINSYLLVHTTL